MSGLQSHKTKINDLNKQHFTSNQKVALLTGLKPKLEQTIRAENPLDMFTKSNSTTWKHKRLYKQFYNFNRNNPNFTNKEHLQNKCRLRQNSNFSRSSSS